MAGYVKIVAYSEYLNRPLRSFEQAALDCDLRRRGIEPSSNVVQIAEARLKANFSREGCMHPKAPAGEEQEPGRMPG